MINRLAKITAYNYDKSSSGCEDFSMNVYWGAEYKSVFYVDGSQGRSEFEQIIETKTDVSGQSKRTQNTSIEKHIISIIAISPLLPFLHSVDKCDVKQIEYLDTGKVYNITNIDIDDQGGTLDPTQLVYITFEDQPITKVSSVIYDDDDQKTAFWDNDDNGSADIDGEAQYNPTSDWFNTWQLYYEADGTTPATSGDVILLAYAESTTGAEALVGIFEGEFGDSFSDSSKWQSTQNIWDYFNLSDTVGHTNRVQFDKKAFAEDNGYYSSESEVKAVALRFELGIDGSDQSKTTLEKVYTLWGAFNDTSVKDFTTQEYGVTIVSKINQKNTLATIQDIRNSPPNGSGVLSASAQITDVTPYYNTYIIDISPSSESYYTGGFVTNGGYFGESSRGSFGGCDFVFSVEPIVPITQTLNVLNFTLGTSPFIFGFTALWERQTGCGAYGQLADINAAGDAKCYLDGVLVSSYLSIAPGTPYANVNQNITLTDTEVHTVELRAITTSTYTIGVKFDVQLKPLF